MMTSLLHKSASLLLLPLFFSLILVHFPPCFCSASSPTDADEAKAYLLKWKSSLENQSQSVLSSWVSGRNQSPCKWIGISCDNSHQITNLSLSGYGLKGTLHSLNFSSLPNLVSFDLSNNSLSGPIPASLGNLSNLTVLYLWSNTFSGSIPQEIGSLKFLIELDLSNNFNLVGSIPSSLGNLTNLSLLQLYGNLLTGSIPPEIGNLKNLQTLDLSINQLSGSIPSSIGNLRNLSILFLNDNFLSGSIPSSIGNLTMLNELLIYENNLSGPIPLEIGKLQSLSDLLLFSNKLSGHLPLEMNNLTNLNSFELADNQLTGPLPGIPSNSDIWLLGVCYKISQDNISGDAAPVNELTEFMRDFSSRIWVTYRKGFDAIEDSKLTSDVGWGCMLRSSQMLISQALLFHRLGRSWRNSLDKPMDQAYVEILHLFGDSEAATFSIHNLLRAGKPYGLAAGSWVGPYATCRSWESLARSIRDETDLGSNLLPMAVYVVSGDEDGERGGAPLLCVEDASRHCFEFSKGQADWTPILLLVPLVLGLDKINPRYVPSLQATFTFPQSVGILGGKPGSSTYIVGVQDEHAFYLDPHEVQTVVNIGRDDEESDTSSYHSDVTRYIPLELIDPSLAIGFYCRDKADFDEFCLLASKLADESNGAPLFTVANSLQSPKPVKDMPSDAGEVKMPTSDADSCGHEDDWQLL